MCEAGMRVVWSYSALPGGETSGGEEIHGATFLVGRAVTVRRRLMTHQCFEDEAAPGWRMLSSLPSCPNPHMRFPMSSSLREIVSRGGEQPPSSHSCRALHANADSESGREEMRIRDLYGYPLRDLFSRRMRRMIRSASKNFVPRPEHASCV